MKTKITNQASQQEKPFPKLMIDKDGEVFLMKDQSTGTIVHSFFKENIGTHNDTWDMRTFKDFTGEVTLSND